MEETYEIKGRCFGNKAGQDLYAHYHDYEWGVPVYDDNKLFEMLLLESAQAGLSWETILKKREGYRLAFHEFNPNKVAVMTEQELDMLRNDKQIVRNRLKIYSARKNALVFLEIQKEFNTFSTYLWGFVDHKPIINCWENQEDVPVITPISDALSKDLKKRGMTFVGSTIIYAYMQSVGLVNDHLTTCFSKNKHYSSKKKVRCW